MSTSTGRGEGKIVDTDCGKKSLDGERCSGSGMAVREDETSASDLGTEETVGLGFPERHVLESEKPLSESVANGGPTDASQPKPLNGQDPPAKRLAKPCFQPSASSSQAVPAKPSDPPKARIVNIRKRRGPYSRPRDRLRAQEVAELKGAFRQAERIGAGLNLAITINLKAVREAGSRTALATKAPNEALRQFRGDMRRFCSKHKVTFALVWVREFSTRAGEHVHMALHMADDLQPAFRTFMEKYTGVSAGKVNPDREIGVLARSRDTSWLVKRMFDAAGWVEYLTKGADGSQGVTTGKRAGCSRNIGKAAQTAQRSS